MSAGGSDNGGGNHDAVASLVGELGDSARRPSTAELARLRSFFADRVLPSPTDLAASTPVGRYLRRKYDEHVVDIEEWPAETSPVEYVESLRATVRSRAGGIRLYRQALLGEWMVLFLARTRRQWRGPNGGAHVVVLFNVERALWVTGFQTRDGAAYAQRQGGWWIQRLP